MSRDFFKFFFVCNISSRHLYEQQKCVILVAEVAVENTYLKNYYIIVYRLQSAWLKMVGIYMFPSLTRPRLLLSIGLYGDIWVKKNWGEQLKFRFP